MEVSRCYCSSMDRMSMTSGMMHREYDVGKHVKLFLESADC